MTAQIILFPHAQAHRDPLRQAAYESCLKVMNERRRIDMLAQCIQAAMDGISPADLADAFAGKRQLAPLLKEAIKRNQLPSPAS